MLIRSFINRFPLFHCLSIYYSFFAILLFPPMKICFYITIQTTLIGRFFLTVRKYPINNSRHIFPILCNYSSVLSNNACVSTLPKHFSLIADYVSLIFLLSNVSFYLTTLCIKYSICSDSFHPKKDGR